MIAGRNTKTLSELCADLGRQIAAHSTMDGALTAITEVALSAIPRAHYASITRSRASGLDTLAATADAAILADLLQYELSSGPCVEAVISDYVVRTGDLGRDPRWPNYGPAAVDRAGVNSVLSIRLLLPEEADFAAGLNVYSRDLDAYDAAAETVGLLLAAHGAIAVSWLGAREKAANLQHALTTNREIGIAMGIIMTAHKVTRDQAFEVLRMASQNTHRKVFEIAQEVADTGAIGLPSRAGPTRGPVTRGPVT